MEIQNVNDAAFNEVLSNSEKVIVKYYAGWCGSCRLIAPKYKKLAQQEQFSDVAFLEVDAENNKEARSKANVNNLPFFAAFKDGELVEGFSASKIEAVEELAKKL